jgi:hemerythrin-like domain-containing protein
VSRGPVRVPAGLVIEILLYGRRLPRVSHPKKNGAVLYTYMQQQKRVQQNQRWMMQRRHQDAQKFIKLLRDIVNTAHMMQKRLNNYTNDVNRQYTNVKKRIEAAQSSLISNAAKKQLYEHLDDLMVLRANGLFVTGMQEQKRRLQSGQPSQGRLPSWR